MCCSVPEDNGSDFIATARCSCCRITPDSCKRLYNNLNLRWDNVFSFSVSLTELAATKLKQNQGQNQICISEANFTPEMCVNLHFQPAIIMKCDVSMCPLDSQLASGRGVWCMPHPGSPFSSRSQNSSSCTDAFEVEDILPCAAHEGGKIWKRLFLHYTWGHCSVYTFLLSFCVQ